MQNRPSFASSNPTLVQFWFIVTKWKLILPQFVQLNTKWPLNFLSTPQKETKPMDQSDSIMLYKEKRISTPGIMSCLEQHLCSSHEIYLLLSTPKIYHNTLRTAKKTFKKGKCISFFKSWKIKGFESCTQHYLKIANLHTTLHYIFHICQTYTTKVLGLNSKVCSLCKIVFNIPLYLSLQIQHQCWCQW